MEARLTAILAAASCLFCGAAVPAGERSWTHLPAGEAEDGRKLHDLIAIGDLLFAVGDGGTFCRVENGRSERIASPTTETLTAVWGVRPDEVYAGGHNGIVLRFDGKVLRPVGEPLKAVKRQHHPSVPAEDRPIVVRYLWASAPEDVYASGDPGAFLHYDGAGWREIDIGASQVTVGTQTRLGVAIVTPFIGPIWGTSARDVWVRKEVVLKAETPYPIHQYYDRRIDHAVLRFDGKAWIPTKVRLPLEPFENVGHGPYFPEMVTTATATWTRFDDALHVWTGEGWRKVTALPAKPPTAWSDWTAAGADRALAYNFKQGFRIFSAREWGEALPVESRGSFRKIALTSGGSIACIADWIPGTILVGK
jgi:hypothetical protein